MADAFIRSQNSNPSLFTSPIVSFTQPNQRGIVNEAGFLMFKHGIATGNVSTFSEEVITSTLSAAFLRNQRLPGAMDTPPNLTNSFARFEAIAIARNLSAYFSQEHADILVSPSLPGCGWVNDVEADILCGTTLYEVKAGNRHFRISDLRQLLSYCALNFSSKKYVIENVALINPRSGVVIKESLNDLCRTISGTSSVRVLGEIVSFISEPMSGYLN